MMANSPFHHSLLPVVSPSSQVDGDEQQLLQEHDTHNDQTEREEKEKETEGKRARRAC